MSINVQNIEQAIIDKMNSSSTELELLEYAKILEKLKTGIVQVVDTFSSLPSSSTSTGELFFVQDEKTVYFSTYLGWQPITTTSVTTLWGGGNNSTGGLTYSAPIGAGVGDAVLEISQSTTWCDISAGGSDPTSFGIKTDGTMWGWGWSGYCILMNACTTNISSPVQECTSSSWSKVAIAGGWGAAIKDNGTLWVWGVSDAFPAHGWNGAATRSPVQEQSFSSNWASVYVDKDIQGGGFGIKTDGTMWGWGRVLAQAGAIGTNSTDAVSSPRQEASLSTNWCTVASTCRTSLGIKTDGTLWGMGVNQNGVLGDGSGSNSSSPVQEFCSATNWCGVSMEMCASAIAVKSDGTIWAWGDGGQGQLGNNSAATVVTTPVQEISSSTNWCAVTSGCFNHGALKTDGTLWLFGSSGNSLFGVPASCGFGNVSSPIQETASATNWNCISGAKLHFIGFKTDTF